MSNVNEHEDVWVHVGVPVFESGEEGEEDAVMVDDVLVSEQCEQDLDHDSPITEHYLKKEEITPISTDLLWMFLVCLTLASTVWTLYLSAPYPCTPGYGTPVVPTLAREPSKSTSNIVSFKALNVDVDGFMLAEHDAFFGVASVRTSHLKSAEAAPVVLSNAVDAKKDADADNEAHMDGIAEATITDKGKAKAVTKRAVTSLQETTKGVVDVHRNVEKKKHASGHKAHHAGERLVAGGTLQQARSVGSTRLSEHAIIPTPSKTVKAGGPIPTSRQSSTGGGAKEPKLAVLVQAPIIMPAKEDPSGKSIPSEMLEANTGDQVPAWKPIKSTHSVTDTKKQENAGAGMSVDVGGGSGSHPTAFIKKTPPSFQVATRVLAGAGVQIPAAVDTSRDIPVVDKARMAMTMAMMQEAPVTTEPDVVVLTKENYRSFLSSNKFAFVVFYGPNCDDCDQLTKEWEIFAQQTKKDQLAVSVGKVDCVHEKSLCDTSMITTFPSFRWYQNAAPLYGYYRNYPRTSDTFLAYAKTKIYVSTTTVEAS